MLSETGPRWGTLGGEIRDNFPEQVALDLVLEPRGSFPNEPGVEERQEEATLGIGCSKSVTEGQVRSVGIRVRW